MRILYFLITDIASFKYVTVDMHACLDSVECEQGSVVNKKTLAGNGQGIESLTFLLAC